MINHRSTRSALAFALAAAAVSGFATLTFSASADATVVTGVHNTTATAINRATDPRSDKNEKPTRAVDTAFQGESDGPKRQPTKFVGIIRDDRVAIRDPRTNPQWHELTSLLPQNFGRLVDISLAAPDEGTTVHVTVLNEHGKVAQTKCTVIPTPGTKGTPEWPDNCTEFVDLSRG